MNRPFNRGPLSRFERKSGSRLYAPAGHPGGGGGGVVRIPAPVLPGTPFLGQGATRCGICNGTQDGNTYATKTFHYMRATLTTLQIEFGNWYVLSQAHSSESDSNSNMQVKATLEYPSGTFTPFLFSGSSALHTVTPGNQDAGFCAVIPPKGAQFWIHTQRVNCPFYLDPHGNKRSVAFGDAVELTSTDKTMVGGEIDGGDNKSFFPMFLGGMTTDPSAGLLLNSICAGEGDTDVDASGDVGFLARGIGPTLPYINLGIASDQLSAFLTSHTKRVALAKRCTAIFNEGSVNDVGDGADLIISNIQAVRALFATWPFIQTTMTPQAGGDYVLTDGSDQTTGGFNSVHTGVNTTLRAGLAGITTLDVCAALEMLPQYSGKWKADGTTDRLTAAGDGTHPTTKGAKLAAIVVAAFLAGGGLPLGPYGYMT